MSKESTATRKRGRRSFTDEFKQDAVNLVVVQGYSFKETADAVGVSSRSLREWHEKLALKPDECGDEATVQQLYTGLSQLDRRESRNRVLRRGVRCE